MPSPGGGSTPGTRTRIDRGISVLGGFVATLAMTIFLYFTIPVIDGGIRGLQMVESLIGVGWVAGLAIHFALGAVVFPLVFVALHERIPGRSATRGLWFGAGLWLLAEIVVVPLLGGGFFHSGSGGLPPALVFLLAHLLYGVALGTIAASSRFRVPPLKPLSQPAPRTRPRGRERSS